MMKNLKKYTLIACSLFTLAACDLEIDITNPGLITEEKPDRPQAGETITYRAQVWVEKNDMEELYGGERLFRQNLEALFRNTTTFWNESTNKFDYRFEWAMGEGDDNLVIYDIKSGVKSQAEYNVYKDKAYGTLNTEKYDFVLFLALRCTKGGLSCGGGGASKQSVVQAYFEEGHDIFAKKWPEKGTYSDLGHEYGHVRGAQDLYQYMIPAENNPVSHVAYDYPKCNMGTGYQEWSDYCSAIFNHNAQYKQITADMTRSTYPKQMLVRITKDGKPVQRATVNFWGSRATFRDIYAEPGNSPYMKKKTDANGEFTINDIYRMFIPDYNNTPNLPPKSPVDEFPFSRWYCFVVEVELDGGRRNVCGCRIWILFLNIWMAGSKNLMCLKYSYNKFSMNILKYLLIACSCLIGAAHAQSPIAKDTIEYRAQVWVDKTDLERYGGEEDFKKNLKKMFHNTTRFWNESPNKFSHYFRFVPAEELYVYDIQGDKNKYDEFKNKAYGPLDLSKYDFVLFLALGAKNEGLSCGGGGASGQSVVMCYIREPHNIFTDALYPNQGTYSNLGHEYGHMSGATDLYQYMIAAEDNPVSHEKLTPPKCNMGTGYRVWSDYCSALFNYTAKMKPLDKDLSDQVFPRKLVIKVEKNGKAKSNYTVNFYGTRAGGKYNKRDVYPKVYRTYQTDKKGKVELTNLYKLYHPDMTDPNIPPKEPQDLFPYSYWFSFLVEVIDDAAQKKYVWLPDVELQRQHLETGKDVCEIKVEF